MDNNSFQENYNKKKKSNCINGDQKCYVMHLKCHDF